MSQVLIVAAEASSTLFAQRLLEHWRAERRPIEAFGVGSREMQTVGFECLGFAEDLAVVGISEVISQYKQLKAVFDSVVAQAAARKPKLAILMDAPDFNLRLAKKLHALGIPVVYYVSPQVWAWRKGRIKQIKKYCDKMLLLFPFEVPFYQKHQMPHEFVGHPVLDELKPEFLTTDWQMQRRRQCGLVDNEFVVGLMPGSRRGELKNLFPIQLEVARRLCAKYAHARILILVAPTFDKEDLHPYLEDVRFPYMLLKDDPFRMIALVDVMLATSGTATLMVGLLRKPMVIIYKMSAFTAFLARLMIKGYFGLPNLILGREVVPEKFQEDANPDLLFNLMDDLIQNEARREKMADELGELTGLLGERGATKRVAAAVQGYLE